MNAKNFEDVKHDTNNPDYEIEISFELTIDEQLELFAEILIDQYLKQIAGNEKN